MYVCLCNGFTDRDVKSAIASGAEAVSRVYQSLGASPQCAKCSTHIRDLIHQERLGEPTAITNK
ncbi:(2Fe-2S)-binding protein [Sneathiella chinensis]|uniref:Bacterioferritin-associated ferredoxin n=1 Tax=Sneathiella chinensis TaxID=349750 RepID=A0ABQ5U510_9PROT|nr:(2Fe-2S)-binding protein [Sneathiella chinensis]GLQ06826.1 bacterioferritin-associated ferredoxin [Sneathiella chinensis]